MHNRSLRILSVCITALWLTAFAAVSGRAVVAPPAASVRGAGEVLPNYDVRIQGRADVPRLAARAPLAQPGLTATLATAQAAFLSAGPPLELQRSALTGGVEIVQALAEPLTQAAPGKSGVEIARQFLHDQAAAYGVTSTEADGLAVVGESVSAVTGLRGAHLEQVIGGVPVFQGEIKVAIDGDGRVHGSVGRLVPGLASIPVPSFAGALTPAQALAAALATVNIAVDAGNVTVAPADAGRLSLSSDTAEILGPVTSWKALFPLSAGVVIPAWAQTTFTTGAADWYTVVDAADGTLLYRKNIRAHASTQAARFSVYVQADGTTPADSPAPQSPTTAAAGAATQFPAMARPTVVMSSVQGATASPDGWIADGGTTTTGNNVDAYLDTDSDDLPDAGFLDNNGRPTGNPDASGRNRDFLGAAPRDFRYTPAPNPDANTGDAPSLATFQRGTVTQLFYDANWYHDRLYALGFTEAAHNFQTNNYGRGGTGGDPVLAEAQDGSGTSNANFSTPADGAPGQMQMYIFTGPTPARDGGIDQEIVFHELTHGLTNRLIGNGAGLNWNPGAGMGEGWSDFYALSLLNNTNADNPDGSYAFGAYATYKFRGLTDNYVYGIRRFPYTTDMTVNPLTWADVDDTSADMSGGIAASPVGQGHNGASDVHNIGELWALTLWEVRSRIIAANGGDVPAGNQTMLGIVTDAARLFTPNDPTFTQARDALLSADCAAHTCANEASIWGGFAKRGLGYGSQASLGIATHIGVRESYALPFLDVQSVAVNDAAPGNASGAIDPGETVKLTVTLKNPWRQASQAVGSVIATLSSATPGVSVLDATSTYGPIAAQGTAAGDTFTIAVAPSVACGSALDFTVQTTSSLGTTSAHFRLRVGVASGTGAPVTITRLHDVTIPDNNLQGVSDALSVSQDLEIAKLAVRIDSLSHTWVGDLSFMIKGPTGLGVELVYYPAGLACNGVCVLGCNGGDNFTNTLFDDGAANDLVIAGCNGSPVPPYTASFKPALNSTVWSDRDTSGQLSRFIGTNTPGTWTAFLTDQFSGFTGTLHGWSLLVTPRAFMCSPVNTPVATTPMSTPTPSPSRTSTVPPSPTRTNTPLLPSPTPSNTVTPRPTPTVTPAGVVLAVFPTATTVGVGQPFDITLQVQAGAQMVDGAALYLDFDPAVLQVVRITAGSALPDLTQNQFDNAAGTLDYVASTLSAFPSGTFTVATVTFNATATAANSALSVHLATPRHSDVTLAGSSVITGTANGTVNVVVTAQLNGLVTLQGRPAPPDARWSEPLQVSLAPPGGGPTVSCTPTTDQSGNFTCPGILPGPYTACVKHSHTLQNCRTVMLVGEANPVNFCTLHEGDANNDNCVQLLDFSTLATAFSTCTGAAGFDARADFDASGCVTLVDFSLLAHDFGQCGPIACVQPVVPVTARQAARAVVGDAQGGTVSTVTLGMAAPRRVHAGDVFDVPLEIETGQQRVDGAAAYVHFDPRVLQVEAVTAGETFPLELRRMVDNTAGTVDYAAATLGDFPAGTFRLATLRLWARHTGPARLVFNRSVPRRSDVTFGGASVLGGRQAARVAIAPHRAAQ